MDLELLWEKSKCSGMHCLPAGGGLLGLSGRGLYSCTRVQELLHLISRVVELHLFQRGFGALKGHLCPFLVPQHLPSRGRCDSLQPELMSEDGAVQPLTVRNPNKTAGAQTLLKLDSFSRGMQGKANPEEW